MLDWKNVAYKTLEKYCGCKVNKCKNSQKLYRDLSLLIEDLRKNPAKNSDHAMIVNCAKNINSCQKCSDLPAVIKNVEEILLVIRNANNSVYNIADIFENKLKKVNLSVKCYNCDTFESVFEDFVIAVSTLELYKDFKLDLANKIDRYNLVALEICAKENCSDRDVIKKILEYVADEYLRGEKKSETIDETYQPIEKREERVSFIFEDEKTKIERIVTSYPFNFVMSLKNSPSNIKKLENERLSHWLSILKVFDCVSDEISANNLEGKWLTLLTNKKLTQLEKEIKLLESVMVITSSSYSIYLHEKLKKLEFLIDNSKKTKEELIAEAERVALDEIKILLLKM